MITDDDGATDDYTQVIIVEKGEEDDEDDNGGIPGFEIFVIITGIAVALVAIKKKRVIQ